ncbi:MAG: hypothetical protein AB1630_12205 [bacterium]
MVDKESNLIDAHSIEPWNIKDCCITPQHEYLFVILSRPRAFRGERLAIFSITYEKIEGVLNFGKFAN